MHVLDLQTGDYYSVKTNENIEKFSEGCDTLQEKLTSALVKMVFPENAAAIKEFSDLSTLPDRLKDKKIESVFMQGRFNGWCNAVFIRMTDETPLRYVLFTVYDVNNEVTRLHEYENLQAENSKLHDIINALMDGYSTVCNVNLDIDKIEILRIAPRIRQSLGISAKKMSFKALSLYYINNGVYEEDRPILLEVVNGDYIRKNIEIGGNIVRSFRNNLGVRGELKIVRTDENSALFGFIGNKDK